MSDHAGPQSKERRIPSSLIITYVQYKKDTRAVISWLVSHGTSKQKQLPALSLQDLLGLAETAQSKAVEMPRIIDFQFRAAISARAHLSKWYRRVHDHYGNDDQETCNHEHFTTCLKKIYSNLCECCAKPKDDCTRGHLRRSSLDDVDSARNRFESLALGYHNNVQPSTSSALVTGPGANTKTKKAEKKHSDNHAPRIVDDTLGEAFELRKEIQEIHDLLTTTQHAWACAAKGRISLVEASFIAHSASAAFEDIETRLKTSCDVSDPGTLRCKYMQMERDLGPLGPQILDENDLESPVNQMIEALREYWHLLVQLKLQGPQTVFTRPVSQFTLRQGSDASSKDKECLTIVLKDIGQHIQSGVLHNSIVRAGSPIYPEVGFFLTGGENDCNSLRCSFGLQLLLHSYRSYLFSMPRPVPAACRLQALKFAQEASTSVKAALDDSFMPCRCCPNGLTPHLDSLQSDIQSFLQTKIFDLYFQSPWVSGSQMLEMLDRLFCQGLRLFNYGSYVTAILHAYNVLRQFTDIQPCLLFESLIDNSLSSNVFPGGLPHRNFKASYTRAIGGRLRFDLHKHKGHHKSGSHSMTIPSHAAKATAGLSIRKSEADADHRFDVGKISLFYDIKHRDYRPTKENWKRVYIAGSIENADEQRSKAQDASKPPDNAGKATCSHHNPTDTSSDSSICPAHRLQHLQRAVHKEFSGSFPIAKINFFTVFLTCVRIVRNINAKYHEDVEPGLKCLCFVEEILRAGDLRREDEKHPLGFKKAIETAKEVIVTELGGKGLEDFFWKGI